MSANHLDPNNAKGDRDNASLLSPIAYDDDASSINSRDQDTDSEDDALQQRARNSRELLAHDRIVLMEEEELDQLVTDSRRKQELQRRGSALALPNPFKNLGRKPSLGSLSTAGSSNENLMTEKGGSSNKKKQQRRARRETKKKKLLEEAQHGEDGELMYEMEEGGMKEGSSTGDSSESDEYDRRHLNAFANAKAQRGRSWRRWLFIHSLIAIGFAILVLAAWKLSKGRKSSPKIHLASNGTALFAPTTIIISLDGFRADFLQRGLTPTLNAFVKEGVSPKWMHPSFPSVTFPNHYTLATGLYPEAHGIVGNTFWDPELKAEFHYTDPARSLDPKWWGGEPFWVTAEKQGVRTAIHMWPGSEAHVLHEEPTFVDKFNGKEKLDIKVSRILGWLDMPGKESGSINAKGVRPQLIAAYVPNVDSDGHKYGPNSTEIRTTIKQVDTMMGQLFQGLSERNLTDIVNVIVVSDHGMATTDTSRALQLEDLVDTSKIEHIDGWPLYGLRPKNPDDLQGLYDGLAEKAKSNPNYDVYLRDVNMPERFHFSKNDRIAPLWIIPKTGWVIVTKEEFDVEKAKKEKLVVHPRGLHGYDHEHPLMRAIFIARGPAFPHPGNSQVAAFQNIEVYNLLCDSLGLTPKPNNGTLRLPLKPVGTHDAEDEPKVPEDPVTSYSIVSTSLQPEKTKTLERPSVPPEPTTSPQPAKIKTIERPSVPPEPKTSSTTLPKPSTTSTSLLKPHTTSSGAVETPTQKPQDDDTKGDEDEEKDASDSLKDKVTHIWDWFTNEIDKVWHKITGEAD
ncbi:ectonucleotide pyrophosphatase phosphodiesterase family member 1 3 [Trichoderma arundinaceum]|uniref:Ectonucleotide pyrophosphatase phosphodiesterase family member 1 3 n=1 Tax=Trichoderma arundinaceum TaxID=490622 RepID=A0A395NWK2_TRIAR|nr:ectonucleotide pyrophosphatase phosphodiesterase family member 1 3 [Trichoderma arundinaceum]